MGALQTKLLALSRIGERLAGPDGLARAPDGRVISKQTRSCARIADGRGGGILSCTKRAPMSGYVEW